MKNFGDWMIISTLDSKKYSQISNMRILKLKYIPEIIVIVVGGNIFSESRYVGEIQGLARSETPSQFDSFQWDDLDLNKPAFCGGYKCFFYDSNNSDNGYLIRYSASAPNKALGIAVNGWKKAKELESKYHILHLFLDSPFEVHLPDNVVDLMNADSYHPNQVVYRRLVKGKKVNKGRFQHNTSAIVQPSKAAPAQSIILKCLSGLDSKILKGIELLASYNKKGFFEQLH